MLRQRPSADLHQVTATTRRFTPYSPGRNRGENVNTASEKTRKPRSEASTSVESQTQDTRLEERRQRLLTDSRRPGLGIETVLHYRQLADLLLIRMG